MVKKLMIKEDIILRAFKTVFKKYGSVEIPDAVSELNIWNQVNLADDEVDKIQKLAQRIFLTTWEKNFHLYPNVESTLQWAKKNKILIFGLSDAFAYWVEYRLKCLNVLKYFDSIYSRNNDIIMHSLSVREFQQNAVITTLTTNELKPNTIVIDRIINFYKIGKEHIYMIGDSLEKDISTAQRAGVQDVWAKYGTRYNRESGKILRSITPWTKKRQDLNKYSHIQITPTYIINDFGEIKQILS
nr:HAD family hydrolase [Pseudobacteroides cellulosolvens]